MLPISFLLLVFASQFVPCRGTFKVDSCKNIGDPCTLQAKQLGINDENETVYEPIDVGSPDFSKFSRKIHILNGTYTLENSTLKSLPRSSLLSHIYGHRSIIIRDNAELTYANALPSLKYVGGSVVIKNNPNLRLDHRLFQRICFGKGAECDVDVVCKTKVYINQSFIIGLHPDCTVVEGDIVVNGLTEEPSEHVVARLGKLKGVIGSIRLIHNEIHHFEFLESIQFIENERGGCALDVHTNVNLTHLGLNGLERVDLKGNRDGLVFCTRNNLLSGKEKFYLHSENDVDKEIMTALESFGPFEIDPQDGASMDWAAPPPYDMTAVYVTITGVVSFLIFLALYTFWILDWKYKLYFYTKVTPFPLRKVRKRVEKPKDAATRAAEKAASAARRAEEAAKRSEAKLDKALGLNGIAPIALRTPKKTQGSVTFDTPTQGQFNCNDSTYFSTGPLPRGGHSVYVKR